MKGKLLAALLLLMEVANVANAQSTPTNITATTKATATLASVCTISAQNVNFGQISLPIGSQSATSSLILQCTKGSSYTIGLAYGGMYGKGTNGDYWIKTGVYNGYGAACQPYQVWVQYNSGGTQVGTACSNNPPTGITLDSSTGHYNVGANYAYGMLNGASKGDTIGYAIQVPNNPSEVWNTGNYTYSSTATGTSETIPLVATLKPSNTPNSYPSADTYMDTVTATINY